ncbi:ABC transporter permease [Granulosicoccus antarcticus]|uniref:Transport permease protein n=1 Tax=Granulosicoccus antarcticus IMCC3135 TaxID=1192854 RepID=A0A2Z2NS94_9GAMM|nr:ABC transporter permease [Granulosicoccus antarcticus]ASJ71610.1 Polysialic acid transport protein KpsM [Granulosicoccus antarcticus IMCC3135]
MPELLHSSRRSARPPITSAQVAGALSTQARVTKALILRDAKSRYGEHKLGFVWAFLEPALMVSIFVAMFTLMGRSSAGGMPIQLFMITGFVPFMMFREPMSQLQGAITQNKSLLGFPQVTTFDVISARALLEVAVLATVFVVLITAAHIGGVEVRVQNPLGVLAACTLLALFGVGVGFALACVVPLVPSLKQFMNVALGRPLFFGSGLFYTADSIPQPYRDYLLLNPLLHMIELLRSSFFYSFETAHGSWRYAIEATIASLAFGLLVHQAMKRRAIVGL